MGAVLLLTACSGASGSSSGSSDEPPRGPSAPAGEPVRADLPALQVDVLADGLDHPWDAVQAPDGTLLVGERGGALTAVLPDGEVRAVEADFGDLFAQGETGLMGLAVDPGFADGGRFYTCQGVTDGVSADGPEIQVIAWELAADRTSATRTADPLVGGIPVNSGSGRHGGCRLAFGPDGELFVGTGDNAVGENPQDLATLAGKVLRVDPATGEGLPDNPHAGGDGIDDRIWTYGHRNVQGLAVRPGSGQLYAVEHGPDRDDEVNLLERGANYGWDPGGSGSYDESVPMTDPEIPDAVAAVWSSGSPTVAPSGATFVDGEQWGAYDGVLLIALLKDTGVLALELDEEGAVEAEFRVPELEDEYGRIRSVRHGTDGALYVTTDNGGEADALLRVTPR